MYLKDENVDTEAFIRATFAQLGYEPNPMQWPIYLDKERFKLVAGGWRGGKSDTGGKYGTLYSLISRLGWLIAPTYQTSRNYELKYMIDDFMKLNFGTKKDTGIIKKISYPERGPCSVELINGCRIETKSADDPTSLGGEGPDFLIVCETAQLPFEVWDWIRGRAAQEKAPIIMTGTFEGAVGWYVDFYNRWSAPNDENAKAYSLPTWANLKKFPLGRDDPELKEIEANTNKDTFMMRYAGIPVKLTNLVLPEFTNVHHIPHVGEHDFDPNLPVELCVDPGYRKAGAVEVLQQHEDQLVLVDEVYVQGYTTEGIIDICKVKPWWPNSEDGGYIDIAGKQHGQAKSAVEVWRDYGRRTLVSKFIEEEEGINVLRDYLKINPLTNRPRLLVNYKCRGFIAECGGGRSPIEGLGPWLRDPNTGKAVDANNHATKAVIYGLVNKFGYTSAKRKSRLVFRSFY